MGGEGELKLRSWEAARDHGRLCGGDGGGGGVSGEDLAAVVVVVNP